ncbi:MULTISPECIES: histidinol-phosphatase HisJ [Priestia]|uniref:histidinol-phosphatase HisJ n=1 Tax=Priestia TaxID=2800373 RepID=UPI001D7B095D|nr:histidinol-phosphatase HisJ [Priestia megaterium]CAH0126920.1 Histidinol-phosphatase [Priestia megaterium]
MKVDKHIHTPFCPHGSPDSLQQYVEQAISLNFCEISFTEHAPLPKSFSDPTPDRDSGMDPDKLDRYIQNVQQVKKEFERDIRINIGLEVDFIEGFEHETIDFLNEYGPYLDDSILSVHFLKHEEGYDCLDFSADVFAHIVQKFGSVSKVYDKYYNTVLRSVQANLGVYKPKRIGHMTLVHKFQTRFPYEDTLSPIILAILDEIKMKDLALDYNGAGLFKPLCKEAYPAPFVVKAAQQKKIPLVYGSDAHCAKDLGQGYGELHLG